ncbi:MAG TPA: hypothetical protein VHV83_02885 [Armatimonadota bacterium]|nr:hypothetical protein [Armatimonadota bacterium]
MMQPDMPPPTSRALERLFSEIYLRIRQGRFAEATDRLSKAKEIAPDHPQVIEVEGDIAFAQGRFSAAEKLYKQALAGDPHNTKLEEKFGTAVLKVHMPDFLSHKVPDDSPWANHVSRNPLVSALQSMCIPGLGQLYNGDWLKSIIVFGAAFMLGLGSLRHIGNALYSAKNTVESVSFSMIIGELFHGSQIILTLLMLIVWIFAILDAWTVARNTD